MDRTSPDLGGARVLVVDDDPLVVRLFSLLLSEEGYRVSTGSQGAEAVHKARTEPPDLILLDVQMPDVDGYEATRRLKADPLTRDIPVILITGLGDPENKLRGLEAGADEFLAKPVDRSELLVRIRSMLRLRDYQRQLRRQAPMDGNEEDESSAGPGSIAVVLEDSAERNLVTASLAREGYAIAGFAYAPDVLPALLRTAADLVILDSSTPPPLLQAIQNASKAATTLALVPPDDPQLRVRLLDLGVGELLVRPFDTREAALRVSRLIRQRAALATLERRYQDALSAASSDSMTKLSNHGYFRKFLELEMKRSQRKNHPTSLIMLDIDDFKAKNDNYGHATGDMILIATAERIRKSVREIDLAARYGGEEFAVVLPYTDKEGAAVVAERIRTAIAGFQFPAAGSPRTLSVTASLGVAVCPEDAASPDELIRFADERLYRAKEFGKNRVCFRSAL